MTLLAIASISNAFAQSKKAKAGFYFQPEYSTMFLKDHIGNAVGFNIGFTTRNEKWDIGMRYYGRSGPINQHKEYDLVLESGTTYKGKSALKLGADHGYLALETAYNLALSDRLLVRFPISFGQLGAGFYLKGEDRLTPDGRRVSEWEDELQNGTDAGFGLASEIGTQLFYQPFKSQPHIMLGTGVLFTNTYGYSSFLGGDDFYNNKFRLSFGLRVKI